MIVFPHMPKTGGTSFRKSLQEHYRDRFLQCHMPPRLSPHARLRFAELSQKNRDESDDIEKRYDIIYGHFCIDLYANDRWRKGMFFRDPPQRLISEWHYHRSVGRDVGDIHRFANKLRQKNIYQLFLGKHRVEDLDFVGLTEHYAESVKLFERIFGVKLDEKRTRVGSYEPDDELLERVRRYEVKNIEIYEAARRRFDELCRKYL